MPLPNPAEYFVSMSASDYFTQGNALMGQGRPAEAEACYRKALQLQPGLADAFLNLGVALKSQGRFGEAEHIYLQALRLRPDFVEALNNLANIVNAEGRLGEAEAYYRRALVHRPEHLEAHINLSRVLLAQGRVDQAEVSARQAIALRPEVPEAHNALAVVLKAGNRLAEAGESCRRAIALRPDYPDAHNNLGNLLQQQGQPGVAEVHYRRALAGRPRYAEALNNLGNCLHSQGRYSEAEACYRSAIEINPRYADAIAHLGSACQHLGRLDEAEAAFRRVLELRPDDIAGLNNLAHVRMAQGEPGEALGLILRALDLGDMAESRLLFMTCITRFRITQVDAPVRATMIRALTVPWGQTGALARVGAEIVKLTLQAAGVDWIAALGERSSASDRDPSLDAAALAAAAGDELLVALLGAVQLRDADLERFLGMARRRLLDNALANLAAALPGSDDTPPIHFYAALARQCFINEYVYFVAADEAAGVANLRDAVAAALAAGTVLPAVCLLGLAAYQPLHALPAAGRLLERAGEPGLAAVLRQQVGEPRRERELAARLPCLTPIDDVVSLLVQQMYTENPYPRWMSPDIQLAAREVNEVMRATFPGVDFAPLAVEEPLQVLVAGCGTGAHPISVARRFRAARVLAIDLSPTSLAYGWRKAEELGISSIEFAQADILRLGDCARRFDVIESSGVLHHLADPAAGLRVLVDLLRPGGFMQLGFYSTIARRDITQARDYIRQHGFGASPEEIRRCRRELMALGEASGFVSVTRLADFFGTSTCRDLLFHVQESCLEIPQLRALLDGAGLRFLGFDVDPAIRQAYRQRFPDDPAATSFDHWHVFETENPDTFIGMYQFSVQKPADPPAPV